MTASQSHFMFFHTSTNKSKMLKASTADLKNGVFCFVLNSLCENANICRKQKRNLVSACPGNKDKHFNGDRYCSETEFDICCCPVCSSFNNIEMRKNLE